MKVCISYYIHAYTHSTTQRSHPATQRLRTPYATNIGAVLGRRSDVLPGLVVPRDGGSATQ